MWSTKWPTVELVLLRIDYIHACNTLKKKKQTNKDHYQFFIEVLVMYVMPFEVFHFSLVVRQIKAIQVVQDVYIYIMITPTWSYMTTSWVRLLEYWNVPLINSNKKLN